LWENTANEVSVYGTERGHVTAMVGSGGVATRFNYDAFGNMTAAPHGSTVDKSTSGPRYNGYFLDASTDSNKTGQYSTGWRPYRPDIGRFSSLDPAGTPNGPNRYNYCSSEPVNRTDASGMDYLDEVASPEDSNIKRVYFVVTTLPGQQGKELSRFVVGRRNLNTKRFTFNDGYSISDGDYRSKFRLGVSKGDFESNGRDLYHATISDYAGSVDTAVKGFEQWYSKKHLEYETDKVNEVVRENAVDVSR
jgi:RHS repeat-associated protein